MTEIYRSAEGERAVRQHYDQVLARWPVPSERLRVPTREGETFIVACGPPDAPPVLLLHGSMSNAAMWTGDVTTWSAHLRLYAVDMIGEPGLSAPARPPLPSDAYALWLDDVLAALGVDRVSLVGVSLGGWLALDYATRRPERVDRLALMCPGGLGRQKVAPLLVAQLLKAFGRQGRIRAMSRVLGTRLTSGTAEERDVLDHLLLVQQHFRPRLERLPRFGDDELRRLTMPVLVTFGAKDRMLDARGACRRAGRAVPHATVRLLPEAGHLLRGQTEPVLGFLRGNDVPATVE